MKFKTPLSILIFFFYVDEIKSQVQYSGWAASFNNVKINNHFSAYFDLQFRSTNHIEHIQSILVRPGLNYHINKKFTGTVGYAFISVRRSFNDEINYTAEHRIWEQMMYAQSVKNISVTHRLRFEQRFIPKLKQEENDDVEVDGYNKAYRLRYFVRNIIPLNKQQKFTKGHFVAVQNEIFFNTGNTTAVNGKFFDQNRFYTAVDYRFPNKIDVEAGYMNQYGSQKTSRLNNYIAQVAVYKRL